MKQKVVIVGGGPAGLFAAYKLAGKADVTLIERGKGIDERIQLKEKNDRVTGVGGAGLFSDGKLIFSSEIGTNLPEIIAEEKVKSLVEEVEKTFNDYGVKASEEKKEQKKIAVMAAMNGMEYVPAKQAHIGTDKLPGIIKKFFDDINGIDIRCEEEVMDVKENKILTNKSEYGYDKLLLAVGRSGASWLENLLEREKIEYSQNPVDIGMRIEVPALITEEICKIDWDFKIKIRTPTYQDRIRTFCVSPYGYVVKEENYKGFCLVNGHSYSEKKSENTNFAFLVSWKLTEPVKSGNDFGETIAKKASFVGGGLPIIQRLGDLRGGHRSTQKKIEENYVVPTLEVGKEVTAGDIGAALEYRFVLDTLEGLEILNKLVPGVAADSTLLYCPEVKFHGIRPATNKYLETSREGIYIAGDGAGISRGIVGAATSGLLAAEGILKELKE